MNCVEFFSINIENVRNVHGFPYVFRGYSMEVMKYIDLVCAARFGFTLICILFRAEVRALPVQHT